MRKIIYGIFLLIAFSGNAQLGLSQAEYFWDADPGEGMATALVPADGNYNAAVEAIFQSGIAFPTATGNHVFNIRFKDSQNAWGAVFKNVIAVEPTAITTSISLSQAEYFWDVDPGEGAGIPIIAFDGNFNAALETVLQSGNGFPASVGNHLFSIRFKDSESAWGTVFSNVIYVEPTSVTIPTTLTQAEYFWDIDPGEGLGTPVAAFDGDFNAAFENILQTNVGIAQPMGLHVLYLRAKDSQNAWGSPFGNVIYIETTLGTPIFSTSRLTFYPNPVKDILHLKGNQQMDTVQVYNLTGQEVMSETIRATEASVDVSGLPTGSYYVRVNAKDGVKTIKIIRD